MGADEIDIVIRRDLALAENWKALYDEISALKKAAGSSKLKTILATGELEKPDTIFKASMTAMMAGSDFIKTSTGKETVNATLQAGYVMMQAISQFASETGVKVGLKPAGGIQTTQDALSWWKLLGAILGKEWLNQSYFRIGASSLLQDLVEFFNNSKGIEKSM